MKTVFFIFFIYCNLTSSILAKDVVQKVKEQNMIQFVKEIIDTPPLMIDIMSRSKNIDCSKFLKLLNESDERLIDFVMKITYLKCRNFEYDSIEGHKISSTKQQIYLLYYVSKDINSPEQLIKFDFSEEQDTLVFNGISEPID